MTTDAEVDFLMKHGQNTTDRMVPDLLTAIVAHLHESQIAYGGKMCYLKALSGKPNERDGEWYILFDVLSPGGGFDHIEFKITKTGWGRGV